MSDAEKSWSARVAAGLKERYAIERVLGRGGMAIVWLARDRKLKRPVAIKVLDPSVSARVGTERFVREVRITAPLQHPHILPLLDSGSVGEVVYSVMPFVEGESLRDRLERESPLPAEEALLFAREIAEALDYAHQRGIVHRDIKPENILISNGAAVVTDFGIARATHLPGDANLTSVGTPLGTPAYMSPEQATGRAEVDGRSDIYALGVTLFEMLTGRLPFTGTSEEVMRRHREEPPPSPLEARPELAPHVAELVQRTMAKDPRQRFASAGELALALRNALGEPMRQPTPADSRTPAPGTLTPPVIRRPRPWPSRAGGWLMVGAAVAAIAAAVTIVLDVRRPDIAPPAPPRADSAPPPQSMEKVLPLGASAPSPQEERPALERWDLDTAASSAALPPELREASGLATLPDGRLVVHGDEMAVLYVVDPGTGAVEPFVEVRDRRRAGDYEDVTVAGQRLFLASSDGGLLEWNLEAPTDEPTSHAAELGGKCDVESLAYVAPRAALLMLCKSHRMPGARDSVLGFWWPLDRQRLDLDQPFRIAAAGLGPRRFSPSGATWDSVSSHLLLLAGPDHRLAEVDLDGRVVHVTELDPARHPQAEGIAIMHDGRLVIADEGRRLGARITTYEPFPR